MRDHRGVREVEKRLKTAVAGDISCTLTGAGLRCTVCAVITKIDGVIEMNDNEVRRSGDEFLLKTCYHPTPGGNAST